MRKLGKLIKASVIVLAATVSFQYCSQKKPLDNPVRGTISIASDESFKPLVEDLTSAYEAIYPDAHFNVSYTSEQESIRRLLVDSTRLIFVSRPLNEAEEQVIKTGKRVFKTQEIATDGVALIVGKANPDSLITLDDLKNIFSGKVTRWEQIKASRQTGDIVLVFDEPNSSNLSFIRRKFDLKSVEGLNIFSSGSNEKVIDYIKTNPKAIGFIGVNWLSDGRDLLTQELSRGLKVVGISPKQDPTSIEDYSQPFGDALKYGFYPLARSLYIISGESYSGLGGGLMTYIARDVGGLIIMKKGLIPKIPYTRMVETRIDRNI